MLANNPIISYQKTVPLPIEMYIKKPSDFIINNISELLPNWKIHPASIIVVLFYSQIPIKIVSQEVEKEKQRLKQEFLQFANKLTLILQKEKCLIEIIDPQDGKPLNTNPGTINFDIVATIYQLLGLSFQSTNEGCKVLNHPTQNTAIYPTILVSDRKPQEINSILQSSF